MDNFNLHEWVGKGKKNLLNEAKDGPEWDREYDVSGDDVGADDLTKEHSLEEDQLDELKINNNSTSRLIDALARTKEFAKMKAKIGSAEKLDNLVKQAQGGAIEPLMDILKMSGITLTREFEKLWKHLRKLHPDTTPFFVTLTAIVNYLKKEGKVNRDIGPDDFDNFGVAEEDSLEEDQLNEGAFDDLIKAIFSSAGKEAVKKKSEKEVKSLHDKIFGPRNKSDKKKDM